MFENIIAQQTNSQPLAPSVETHTSAASAVNFTNSAGQTYAYDGTILKAININQQFGDNVVLRDLNVEIRDIIRPNSGVKQGQVVGFLGPTGIGKSQLFNILSGLAQPTSGEVLIGKDLVPVSVGSVGVVQQHYPLFDYETVESNLRIAAGKGNIPKAEQAEKIDHYLTKFKMLEHRGKYPNQLSGGQRQRIAIAQQLLCSNNFLFLDEPFSGLDILMIQEVSEVIREVSLMDELNTIIIISHDIVSTAALSDTLWLMGRDRDASNAIIPGARIKHIYDLAQMGLAWNPEIKITPQFHALIHEIETLYPTL